MRAADPGDREEPGGRDLLRSGLRGIGAVALAVVVLMAGGALVSLIVAAAY